MCHLNWADWSMTDCFWPCTSEAADFDGVERSSLQAWISWVDWSLPFAQTAGELELVRGEDEANQVTQQPPAVFLRGVDGFIPLLVRDEERVVLQELLTALQGGGRRQDTHWGLTALCKVLSALKLTFNLLLWCTASSGVNLTNLPRLPADFIGKKYTIILDVLTKQQNLLKAWIKNTDLKDCLPFFFLQKQSFL